MSNIVICLFAAAGFDRAARGVAGAGRRLADEFGVPLHAFIIGAANPEMTEAVKAVADAVTVADQPELAEYQPELYLSALAELCQSLSPRAVLLGNDTYSQELAPRLAHRLGGSAVGDGLELKLHEGRVRVTRSVYGGKAQAVIELKRAPAVVWLRARAFEPATPRPEPAAAVNRASLNLQADARARIVERKAEAGTEARLEDARVIVSGGRGLGGPEPFRDLQALAGLIGAQVAASRAACDAGWVPPSWQVGQTGKKVAPGLYLAVAIHGASQHLAGISDAKVIAAINIDKDAPIFKHCRFGIVEDYRKVVPLLRERLAALQK
ncbi:MAG TPA: electron transfer flavoprotein subunit alpha/FixB family protein [Blastocatellia bacterium]|nr:electron transfer flavoprotein subunit alpha/FixB family protein [Blastocatellia bacterium]